MLTKDDFPAVTVEERRFLRNFATTDQIVEWAQQYAAKAIAAHTAKVLEDVEPVGEVILNYSTHMERCHPDGPMNDVAWLVDAAVPKSGTKLYPAHTVAALAARVAELEGVIDSVLLDIDDDGVAEAQDIAILAMRNIRNGRPQYEGLDAALAAKGQA